MELHEILIYGVAALGCFILAILIKGNRQAVLPFLVVEAKHRRTRREAGMDRCIPIGTQRTIPPAQGIPFILNIYQRYGPRHVQRRSLILPFRPCQRDTCFARPLFFTDDLRRKVRRYLKVFPIHIHPPVIKLFLFFKSEPVHFFVK